MKLFILLTTFLLFSSCAKDANIINSASEKEILQTQIQNSQIILEIQEDATGMWEATGKTLFLRLYDSGIVEFEFQDDKKKIAGKINKTEEINSLKQVKISREEFQKFIMLLKSKDFKIVKETYQAKCCCTDAVLNYKVISNSTGRQKSIDLKRYCNFNQLTNREEVSSADIPIDLSEILLLSYLTRLKYVNK